MTQNENEIEKENLAAVIRESLNTLRLRQECFKLEAKEDRFSEIAEIVVENDIKIIEFYFDKYCYKK